MDRIYTIANQVDDALAGGMTIDEAAAKFGLKKTVVAAVDEHGRDRGGKPVVLPVAPTEVLKLVFATNEGQTQPGDPKPDGAIFVLQVSKIVTPAVRPLAEVRDQAIAAWQAEKRRDKVAKEAEALAAAVKSGEQLWPWPRKRVLM